MTRTLRSAALLTAATLTFTLETASADHRIVLRGHATALTGVRLEIDARPIRLWGIDSPTNAWCEGCGDRARNALASIVAGQHVWCSQRFDFPESGVLDGDIVAECRLGHDGDDHVRVGWDTPESVNMQLVAEGWAVPLEPLRHTFLPLAASVVKAAKKAKSFRRGLWREDLTIPDTAPVHRLNPARIAAGPRTVRGRAHVLDDNRLAINGTILQLAGLAVAKDVWCTGRRNRQCGRKARRALERLAGPGPLTCTPVPDQAIPPDQRTTHPQAFCTAQRIDRDGPCEHAECWVSWRLVREGHAVAKRTWSDLPSRHPMTTLLAIAEEKAMEGPKGIWRDDLDFARIDDDVDDRFVAAPDRHNTVSGPATLAEFHRDEAMLEIAGARVRLFGVSPPQPGWC